MSKKQSQWATGYNYKKSHPWGVPQSTDLSCFPHNLQAIIFSPYGFSTVSTQTKQQKSPFQKDVIFLKYY